MMDKGTNWVARREGKFIVGLVTYALLNTLLWYPAYWIVTNKPYLGIAPFFYISLALNNGLFLFLRHKGGKTRYMFYGALTAMLFNVIGNIVVGYTVYVPPGLHRDGYVSMALIFALLGAPFPYTYYFIV
jgi:hypothetical protein